MGDAAEYFHPAHERHASVVGSMAVPRPRDLSDLEVRTGGRHFEASAEFTAANPRSDDDRYRLHLLQVRAGHVRRAWAYGGVVTALHLLEEYDHDGAGGDWSAGAGTYLRFGAERGLHFTGSVSLARGGSEDYTLVIRIEMRVPLLRHRLIEVDVVGKVWSTIGNIGGTVFGIGEIRTRLANRVSIGVGVTPTRRRTVGYRHIGVGLSLGVDLL